jgi:hypothetical protein
MKKLLSSMALLFLCAVWASAQNYTLKIRGGISDERLKQKMEICVSALLTELSQATKAGRLLRLQQVVMTEQARESVTRLWDSYHFLCNYTENEVLLLTDVNGYEVRNIPVTLKPMGSGYTGEKEKELTISLTRDGIISGIHMALSNNAFHNVVNKGIDVTDTRRRLEILNFVEAFRSYYDEKDISSLQQVYGDDALIITGRVIQRRSFQNDQPSLKPEIVYSKKNKEQYLNALENTFRRNKFIKVSFDSIQVVRHPAKPNFYGVTLHQNWKSSTYQDDGYVFLLWEFKDGNDEHPIVHVRTWQPDRIGSKPLARKDIFTIDDIFIP